MKIILSGLGTFNEDPNDRETLKTLQKLCKSKGIKLYPTYYDWQMEGERDSIESVTKEIWGMDRDEWVENALHEEAIQ